MDQGILTYSTLTLIQEKLKGKKGIEVKLESSGKKTAPRYLVFQATGPNGEKHLDELQTHLNDMGVGSLSESESERLFNELTEGVPLEERMEKFAAWLEQHSAHHYVRMPVQGSKHPALLVYAKVMDSAPKKDTTRRVAAQRAMTQLISELAGGNALHGKALDGIKVGTQTLNGTGAAKESSYVVLEPKDEIGRRKLEILERALKKLNVPSLNPSKSVMTILADIAKN